MHLLGIPSLIQGLYSAQDYKNLLLPVAEAKLCVVGGQVQRPGRPDFYVHIGAELLGASVLDAMAMNVCQVVLSSHLVDLKLCGRSD